MKNNNSVEPRVEGLIDIEILGEKDHVSTIHTKNYVHNRLLSSVLEHYKDIHLASMFGSAAQSSPLYRNPQTITGQVSSLPMKMDTLVLSLGSPSENNPWDDTVLESSEIVSFTHLDVYPRSAPNLEIRKGELSSNTARLPNGDINIVLNYNSNDHIEFDTLYLTGEAGFSSPTPVTDLEKNYRSKELLAEVLYSNSSTSSPSEYGVLRNRVSTVLGRSLVFLSPSTFMVVLGLLDVSASAEDLCIAKFSTDLHTADYDNSYGEADLVSIFKIRTSAFKASYGMGYSVVDISPDGLEATVLSGVSNHSSVYPTGYGISQDQFRNRDVRLVKINLDSQNNEVVSNNILTKRVMMTGNYGDGLVIGGYLYVLSEELPFSSNSMTSISLFEGRLEDSTKQNNNISDASVVLCKYTLSGTLLHTTILYDPAVIKKVSNPSGYAHGDLSLYRMVYDKNIDRILVYQSSYGGAGDKRILKVNPKGMTVDVSPVKLSTSRLEYNKFDNRYYRVVKSELTTKLAIVPVHVAPIATKCKLPDKVTKARGQTMTITYKLKAGNPVE